MNGNIFRLRVAKQIQFANFQRENEENVEKNNVYSTLDISIFLNCIVDTQLGSFEFVNEHTIFRPILTYVLRATHKYFILLLVCLPVGKM